MRLALLFEDKSAVTEDNSAQALYHALGRITVNPLSAAVRLGT